MPGPMRGSKRGPKRRPGPAPTPAADPSDLVEPSAARFAEHVAWLADDERLGRGTGNAGYRAAADYVAEHFEAAGLVSSGIHPEMDLVEIVEITDHPFFCGVQFHPEFQSSPLSPHPIFRGFVAAALKRAEGANHSGLVSQESGR